MKRYISTITIIFIMVVNQGKTNIFLQNDTTKNSPIIEEENIDDVDSVKVKFKNKNIVIDDEKIKISDKKKEKYQEYEKRKWKRNGSFTGHLEGVDIGSLNFVDENFDVSRTAEENFMNLNTNKSIMVSIYPASKDFKIISRRFGLVTSMGFNFLTYNFENENTIVKNTLGIIEAQDLNGLNVKKSTLVCGYLTVPILLELQPFGHDKRAYIAAGVIGELKLYSHTKVVHWEDGDKKKTKEKGDFNLNQLRYGYTARVGFNDIGIYGTYYPVKLFEKDKGPELYPFAIGVSFIMD